MIKIKSKILKKYTDIHGKPKAIVLVDYDLFKDKHQPSKSNYFFSKPCFEKYLLKLFQQNLNPSDYSANLKEKFRKYLLKSEYKIQYKPQNMYKIVSVAIKNKFFDNTELQDLSLQTL